MQSLVDWSDASRSQIERLIQELGNSPLLDTSRWHSICAITLTLKQARQQDCCWFFADERQCSRAIRHFLNLLNRAVYGASFRKGKKRVRVIPVIEKGADRRFHYHLAIEPPLHLAPDDFAEYVRHCWGQVDWAYNRNSIEFGADEGWINYMLKLGQKSALQAWSDCLDWHNFYNA
jgi:hypothetical protein